MEIKGIGVFLGLNVLPINGMVTSGVVILFVGL
nr:MAG TPA: hypothetical protein [Caudoviricetes sp.]